MIGRWCKQFGEAGCMRWVCFCGHAYEDHYIMVIGCSLCECKQMKYKHNDNCEMFCMFNRKLFEVGVDK